MLDHVIFDPIDPSSRSYVGSISLRIFERPRHYSNFPFELPPQDQVRSGLSARNALEKVIARMCAKARIPMLTIATSEDIQRGFESQNYKNIPTSHTTVASFTQLSRHSQRALLFPIEIAYRNIILFFGK